MAPQQPKHEKIANVTGATVSGGMVGYVLGAAATSIAVTRELYKGGISKYAENMEKFFKKMEVKPGKTIAKLWLPSVAGIVIGAVIGNQRAKGKNERYAQAQDVIAEAGTIIAHQETELESLRSEVNSSRRRFADIEQSAKAGGHAERIKDAREQENSELSL
jgi:hypothetical protein